MLATTPAAADQAQTPCPDITLRAEAGLALGTVRVQPGGRGFLELHPRHGISVSSDGVVHQGPWGSAVLHVAAPPGQRITLELAVQQTSEHHGASLKVAELIALDGSETRRLEGDGETLSLRLPGREGPDGTARLRLEIGAVVAYRHRGEPQQASYRLTATCLSVRP